MDLQALYRDLARKTADTLIDEKLRETVLDHAREVENWKRPAENAARLSGGSLRDKTPLEQRWPYLVVSDEA
jgi:hypothetical protein